MRLALLSLLLGLAAFAGAAPAAQATEFGLSDQQPANFSDPRVRALGLQHARLIVPWDAATSEQARTQAWLDAVADAGLNPHIVFEKLRSDHCPSSPCVVPSRAQYRAAVEAFRARWPQVTTFTTWNEVNHFDQPVAGRPELAAEYWAELTSACPDCTIVAGDVLDSGHYVSWLKRFMAAAAPAVPQRWGLHNYADVSYGTTTGTDAVLRTVPGELWIEETGGIVSLHDEYGRPTFSTSESRAAASIDRAFAIARARPRIRRMYLYHWKAHLRDTFDAGLVRPDGTARDSLLRASANIASFGASAGPAPAAGTPQATVSARWSGAKPSQLVLRVRCTAATGICRGTAAVAAETKLSARSKMRVTSLAKRRRYATSAAKRTATIRLSVSTSARSRIRAAKTRRLTVTLAATRPTRATADSALKLGRPAKP